MASSFGHAVLAIAAGHALNKKLRSAKFWIIGIVCAAIPDLDIIAFKFGIPYEHMFGHRGITHSIFFGFLLAFLVMKIFYNKEKFDSRSWLILFGYFSFCTISHGFLDAMTTGGRGIAFFAPFSDERYFLPWRVIKVSPMSISRFFTDRAWRILSSEAFWIGIPSLVFILIMVLKRYFNKSSA